jgi:hypothetical protein
VIAIERLVHHILFKSFAVTSNREQAILLALVMFIEA